METVTAYKTVKRWNIYTSVYIYTKTCLLGIVYDFPLTLLGMLTLLAVCEVPNICLVLFPTIPKRLLLARDITCLSFVETFAVLRRLAVGLSLHRSRFDPTSVRVGIAVDKVILGQKVLQYSPVSIISLMIHAHLFITDGL
jgi:hypothetical protein